MSFIGFDDAWVLWLLPLVLIPLLAPAGLSMDNGWLAFAPRDRASDLLGWALRAAASLALAALLFAMAGPHRPEYTVERVGQGAEIVLLLDRSRSMDEPMLPKGAQPALFSSGSSKDFESKGKMARRLLAEFSRGRPEDLLGMVLFSASPIPVLSFTQKQEMIEAAIAAWRTSAQAPAAIITSTDTV